MQVFSQDMLLQRALQLLIEVNEGTLEVVTPMMMRTLGLEESSEEEEVSGGLASNQQFQPIADLWNETYLCFENEVCKKK